ncbi:MAG: LptF/LptG family permease [Stellaceae bacterium]
MTALDRYILRQCFGIMVFVTAALSAAVWLAQSLRLIDLIVNRGLSIEVFLYLAVLILPRFLDIVLPIGVFIAVLFAFNRLTAESELVVMRSAGLSPLALAKPVLLLAGIAFLVLMSLSLYFLPMSNRAFKDLQFEIRNRDEHGEAVGLLINDNRDPSRPVTILAERAAFVDMPSGSRIVMVNGDRQQYDKKAHKLSVLTFDRYTLDLDALHDAPGVRFREPQERLLNELLFPPAGMDRASRHAFAIEAHQRIVVPLSAFSLALIPLICLLPGEFNRRGHSRRVFLAIGVAFLFELLGVGANDLAARFHEAIPLLYVADLLPLLIGAGILAQSSIRIGAWLPAFAVGRGR